MLEHKIKNLVIDYYLNKRFFNGLTISELLEALDVNWETAQPKIRKLIENNVIRIIDEKTEVNRHIIRIGFLPLENQLESIATELQPEICLYPTKEVLANENLDERFNAEPYKKLLSKGKAQLEFASFDLSILEFYRNDPRYRYENDDIQGYIYNNDDSFTGSDKIYLQSYGFSYDEDLNRYVSVFLYDLSKLSPEHQQMWKMKEKNEKKKKFLHPDFYKNSILGEWGEKISICNALLEELYVINRMCEAINRPFLFHNDFGEYQEQRPKKFNFLIRPTLEEFNNFVLLFDKMISDNINKKFFLKDVEYEKDETRDDGKIIVRQKGTLQILNEWIKKTIRLNAEGENDWEKSMRALKKLRRLRQSPAHAIKEDIFDQKYFHKQRQLIIDVYKALRMIRLLFTNHPNVKRADIKISESLYKGEIWDR